EEPDRPDFDGDTIKSFINGQEVLYFPPQQRSFLLCQSTCVINTFITLVIGFVAAIYILRFRLYSSIGGNASIVASCLNSVQIVIFNMIYNWVAYKLTVRENHRTATSFDDSMIAKLFVFQFVNSYASFYFLAFIAPYVARPPQLDDDGPEGDYVGECGNADCMVPLSTNLGIIFLMNLTVNNLMEILQPYLSHRKKITAEIAGTVAAENVKKNHQGIQEAAKIMTPPELQYLLEEYDVSMCILKEYAETAVQFGLMTVFVSALPISPFVAMIYNFVEIKVDTWKLLNLYQRPIPKIAEDWGAWQEVFTVIAVISVITNAGLVCFTMQTLDHFKLSTRIWVFVGYQWSCFSLMYLCSILIPDKSAEVRIQEQRSEFIISKVIDRVPDEGDEEMNFILDSPTTSTRTTLHDGESTSTKVAINVQTYPFKVSSANDTADAEDVQLTKVSEEER
ncbi:Ano5, partial [Symbiodinium microadriaticum]